MLEYNHSCHRCVMRHSFYDTYTHITHCTHCLANWQRKKVHLRPVKEGGNWNLILGGQIKNQEKEGSLQKVKTWVITHQSNTDVHRVRLWSSRLMKRKGWVSILVAMTSFPACRISSQFNSCTFNGIPKIVHILRSQSVHGELNG